MNIVNLHRAPPTSLDASLTHAYLRAHTGRLNALNAIVENDIRQHAMSRARLEAVIERLIAALDADDGDENLEPSLGASQSYFPASQEEWAAGCLEDREGEHDGRELAPDDGAEPSAPETHGRGFGDCAAEAARRESVFSNAAGVLVTFKAGRLTQARAIAGEGR